MYNSWTQDLKEKEKLKGNTFMVRNRVRWSLFQVIIAGLNTFETAQICIITAIDLAYVIYEFREIVKRRIFRSVGVKIKYIFQEVAIIFFLVVLTIFAIGRGEKFRNSGFAQVLSVIVLVAVLVAIFSEVIAVVWNLVLSVIEFLKERREKKAKELTAKFTALEKASMIKSEDEEIL